MVRHFTVQQQFFLCKSYFNNSFARCARREFIDTYPNAVPPSRSTIQRLVNKFETTGTVWTKHFQIRTVLMEEKLDEIGINIECSPQMSLTTLAQQKNVSPSSARNATKFCDFYLWGSLKDKVYYTNPHTLQELQTNIEHEIRRISVDELRLVSDNIYTQYEACIREEGRHFQQEFKRERVLLEDEDRSGYPTTAITDENVLEVEKMLREDLDAHIQEALGIGSASEEALQLLVGLPDLQALPGVHKFGMHSPDLRA